MIQRCPDYVWFWCAVSLGLGMSTGHPVGLSMAAIMPCVCLMPKSRLGALEATLGYYAAGLWPMISGIQRYAGPSTSLLTVLAIWISCAALLSIPWTVAWTPEHRLLLWRIPAALAITIVPPLGLVGFLCPLTGAGFIFPGCMWAGLVLTALIPGAFCALTDPHLRTYRNKMYSALAASLVLAIVAHLAGWDQVEPPLDWATVNTHFGDVSLPFKDYEAAQFVQQQASDSKAKVLIFPEFVVPRWSEAIAGFWSRTLAKSQLRGQILVLGAGIPSSHNLGRESQQKYDFEAAISALRSLRSSSGRGPSLNESRLQRAVPEPLDNTLLVLDAKRTVFYQRIPVPLGMWRPFDALSVPLRLNNPGVVVIDRHRAAVLICYEQLIPWPTLTSVLQKPSVLVGISNTFWFNDTAIPLFQASTLRAWARLFRIPFLSAVNS